MAAVGASPYRVSAESAAHSVTVRRNRLVPLLSLLGAAVAIVLMTLVEMARWDARNTGLCIGLGITLALQALVCVVFVAELVPALRRGGRLTVRDHRVTVERLEMFGETFVADAPPRDVEGVIMRAGKRGKQEVYGVDLRLSRGRAVPIVEPAEGLSKDVARARAAEAWALVQRAQRREL